MDMFDNLPYSRLMYVSPFSLLGGTFSPVVSFHLLIADVKRRRRRGTLVFQKKRRRLLPYVPSEDPARRLAQMRSLALALTSDNMEFSNDLNYRPGMAPREANQSRFEIGGMQVQFEAHVI